MKRLFIVLPIKSESSLRVAQIWRNDRHLNQNRKMRVNPEYWHITFYFLSNAPESLIDLIQQLIKKSFSQTQAFTTQLIGAGLFPNTHNPKALWLGIEYLKLLMPGYVQLGDLLRKIGLSLDNKLLKPHLTVIQIRNLNHLTSFESLLKEFQHFSFGKVAINRVTLYESTNPNSPVYTPFFEKQLIP